MAEPVRLAAFLRERCARNQYGLRYLNPEQTLVIIPWPVVPRDNEEAPPGFQMFQEWAEFSHRRRGINENAEKETPTQQKHRFRNALARANGIAYRKDIVFDGFRVYELIDCRRTNGSDVQSPSSQLATEDCCDDLNMADTFSPNYVVPPSVPFPDFTSTPHHSQLCGNYFPNSYQNRTSDQLAAAPTMVHYNGIMPNGQQHDDPDLVDLREILDGDSTPVPMESQHVSAAPIGVNGSSSALQDSYYDPAVPAPVETRSPELVINVRFRQEEAPAIKIFNPYGCRVFFGKNVPDLSQLLEKEHLENLMKRFRKHKDAYFGNENFEQIQLPKPEKFMSSSLQSEKTQAIFQNMERGFIIGVEHSKESSQWGIPDVYVNRLCQTRWAKVFDGKEFCEKLAYAEQGLTDTYPSPTFSFSLGQRPTNHEEHTLLLVCLTVTVQRALDLVQSRLDSAGGSDVCISQITSTDEEAKTLANQLTETLTLK